MALITKAVLQALQTGFSTIFRGAYRDTPTPVEQLATIVPSSHKIETYGWMQRMLEMREWIGPRVIQGLKTHAYQLENKSYEATLAVDREEIEDDSLGLFDARAAEMGRVAARIWFKLLIDALVNGNAATSLGFDGVPFFSTSHPLNPAGVQSNNFVGAGFAFSEAALIAGVNAMKRYTGEDGRFMGVSPTHLIVPPELEIPARKILNAALVTNGGTNVLSGYLQIIVIPELAATGTGGADSVWFLADLSAPIKPLILQKRKDVEFVSKTALTDDNVFFARQFIWGVDCRGVAGYGPWWLAARFATA
jgi:phage major head subunit gpT-like protein